MKKTILWLAGVGVLLFVLSGGWEGSVAPERVVLLTHRQVAPDREVAELPRSAPRHPEAPSSPAVAAAFQNLGGPFDPRPPRALSTHLSYGAAAPMAVGQHVMQAVELDLSD